MNIRHHPVFDTALIADHYAQRDGVEVRYVCTTDLSASDVPVDVFYRDTPHPEFGNRYFGIYRSPGTGQIFINDADRVEDLVFGCVINDQDELEYSESHHSFKHFKNGNMIDGGRAYVRASGKVSHYVVHNGEMVPAP